MLTKTQIERAKKEVTSSFGFEPSTETIENAFEVIQNNKARLIENNSVRGKVWELQLFPGVLAHVEYDRVAKLITAVSRVPDNASKFNGEPQKKRRQLRR